MTRRVLSSMRCASGSWTSLLSKAARSMMKDRLVPIFNRETAVLLLLSYNTLDDLILPYIVL
jgi:hypothetical protein